MIQVPQAHVRVCMFMGGVVLLLFSQWVYAVGLSCPANPDEGPNVIYQNGFEAEWGTNGSWPTSLNKASVASPIGISDDTALRVVYAGSWTEGLAVTSVSADVTGARSLVFRIRSEQANQQIFVKAFRLDGSSTQTVALTNGYLVPFSSAPFVASKWYSVSIPIIDFIGVNSAITGFAFENSVPGTIYIDDMSITPDGGAFLSFPLDCSNTNCTGAVDYRSLGAYTPNSVISIVDHSMTTPYLNEDGIVHAWTQEKGVGTAVNLGCYLKEGGGNFSIAGTYLGDFCGLEKINYDSHPGFDYDAKIGTPVKAAAPGVVVSFGGQRCIPNMTSSSTCNAWGAVGIDHGNGYVTQYLHMSSITVNAGDLVTSGQLIGASGNKTPPEYSLGEHLHFEVLKRIPGSSGTLENDYRVVDPYGWTGSCETDPLYKVNGFCNIRLWK
jgi:Peptidase family M23